MNDATPQRRPRIQRVTALIWPYVWTRQPWSAKASLVVALVATGIGKVSLVASPFFLGEAINRLAEGRSDVEGWALAILGFVVGYAVFRTLGSMLPLLREWLFAPIQQRAERWAAVDALAHLHRLSVRFHEERRTGALSQIIERGVRSVDFLIRFLIFNIIPTSIELVIGTIVLAVQLALGFGVIAAVSVTAYIVFTVAFTNHRVKLRRRMNESDQNAKARAVDSLLNFDTVKAFTAERFEAERYDRDVAAYARAALKTNRSLATLNLGQGAIINGGLAATAILASWMIARGELEVGALTAALLVLTNLYVPMNILGFAYREIRQSFVDLEALATLLDEPPDVVDQPGAKTLRCTSGELAFENVRFGYDPRRPILQGVSFRAPAGGKIAIVGPTGAGKSTIAKLVFRFYDTHDGRIAIDGQDVRDVTQESLRRLIGIVPQETTLFNDTIGWNIRYGHPDAPFEDVRDAARRASLLDFIEKLPDGWDTMVGERGVKLSGGEKQRVAIARALLKNPPILILDEATSALDSATEAEIQAALDEAVRGRTTIAVAHRLSTIADADEILVLQDGRIVERGDHGTLLEEAGVYADMWRRQAERGRGRGAPHPPRVGGHPRGDAPRGGAARRGGGVGGAPRAAD